MCLVNIGSIPAITSKELERQEVASKLLLRVSRQSCNLVWTSGIPVLLDVRNVQDAVTTALLLHNHNCVMPGSNLLATSWSAK